MGRFRASYCVHGKEAKFCTACDGRTNPSIREVVVNSKGQPKRNQKMEPSLQRRKGR